MARPELVGDYERLQALAREHSSLEVMGPVTRLVRAAFHSAGRGNDAQIERVRQILKNAAEEVENVAGAGREDRR
jgi:hypothetical protein